MASDPAGRGRRRALRIALILPILLLLAAFGFGGWLLGSDSGARAAFSAANALAAGAFDAQGIGGPLSGPLQIERLTLDGGDTRVVLERIRINWSPLALLQGRLHLSELRVGRLGIVKKIEQKAPPPRLPDRIGLPFKLQADLVRIDGGEIGWGALDLVTLGAFAFRIDFDGARYRLSVDQLAARSAAVSGKFNGQATLSAAKPYALQGSFSSSGEALVRGKVVGATGTLGLDGSLMQLAARFGLALGSAQMQGSALLQPFSEQPLGKTDISAKALDLSGFDPAWPQTAFDGRLSVTPGGAGELALSNGAAGLNNESKVPLSALQIAFLQQAGQFRIERITAALGSAARPAGNVSGTGLYAEGALTLALRTEALDLQRLDRRLRVTRLSGRVDVKHAAGKQQWAVAFSEPLKKKQNITLTAQGTLADTALTIERAELQAGGGRIAASGRLDLAGPQGFSASGRFQQFRLQQLGDFAQWPGLDLTGDFSLKGQRQPRLEADLSFKIGDSKLAGRPLQGEGQVQLRADRLLVPKLSLAAGANRLQVQGTLAQGESRLTFALNAPQLAQLGPEFGGAIDAHGEVRGSFARPRIVAEWKAGNVRAPGQVQIANTQGKAEVVFDRGQPFSIEAAVVEGEARGVRAGTYNLDLLSASVRFAPQPGAPLRLALHAQGVLADGRRIDDLRASADGTTAQHAIGISITEPKQNWLLKARGGLKQLANAPQWQGNIEAFDATGRFSGHLAAPASLLLSQQRVQLERLRIEAESGYFALEQFTRDERGIVTRGHFERLQLAQLLRYLEPVPPVKTDLQLGGEWDVRIADRSSGSIQVRRERGDVTVTGNGPVTLGLRSLDASLTAADGRLALKLHADGQQLGQIDASAGTQFGGAGGRFAIAPDAAVSGAARVDIPSLGWVGPLLAPTLIVQGRLQSEISLAGTFGQPRLDGRISGNGLRLFLTDLGVDLRDGVLDSEFKGDSLILNNLNFKSERGRLDVSGPIKFSGGKTDAQLALKAERFAIVDRADRRIVVSGASQVGWSEGRATLRGAFTLDSAAIDIGRTDTPQLSDDVVIVGRKRKAADQVATTLDIDVALGDDVVLKGQGLDVTLAGRLHLASAAGGALRAQGNLRVVKGSYTAYGRALAIEQGLLRFGGPLNNPALDILAMRRRQQVEAGVSVRGTVLAPRVTLVSEPTVPDAEKLSWLVLGRGLDAVGATDLGALQSAAGALFSEGAAAGVQAQIATAFGLDTVSIGASPDNLEQRIVTLGKQVSTRLYVSYQQGIDSVSSVVLLRYTLTPRLSLELEAGTRGAFSLFYNMVFD